MPKRRLTVSCQDAAHSCWQAAASEGERWALEWRGMAPIATPHTCLAPCYGLLHPAGSHSPEPGPGCGHDWFKVSTAVIVPESHGLAAHLLYIFPHENCNKMTCCTEYTVHDSCKAWFAQVKAGLLQYLHMDSASLQPPRLKAALQALGASAHLALCTLLKALRKLKVTTCKRAGSLAQTAKM